MPTNPQQIGLHEYGGYVTQQTAAASAVERNRRMSRLEFAGRRRAKTKVGSGQAEADFRRHFAEYHESKEEDETTELGGALDKLPLSSTAVWNCIEEEETEHMDLRTEEYIFELPNKVCTLMYKYDWVLTMAPLKVRIYGEEQSGWRLALVSRNLKSLSAEASTIKEALEKLERAVLADGEAVYCAHSGIEEVTGE